jgi:lysozyme
MALDRPRLRAELIRDENEILHAYRDSRTLWTIGVGCLIDPRKGAKPPPEMTWPDGPGNITERCMITRDVSQRLLDEKIDRACASLDARLPWWRGLSDPRSTALGNMCFNMGIGEFQNGICVHGLLTMHTSLELIRTGQYAAAAVHLRQSLWAKQTKSRAERLATQIETGEWQ